MYVVKRDGRHETVEFDKITARIKKLAYGLDPKFVEPIQISLKVIQGVYSGVTTAELDELAAQTAAYCATQHPDFSRLAARISVSNLHKNTTKSFSKAIELFHSYIHPKTGEPASLIADDVYDIVMANKDRLDSAIIYDRDFDFDYFGFKTLERSYLLKIGGKVMERPQQMLMRVSVGIHKHDIDAAIHTYNCMSQKLFTHATPTLFNAGTPRPQLSSCFLLTMQDDSITGIYDTLKQCATISKYAGGVGLAIHNVRARDSYIRGSNGSSNGIVPMLRVYNNSARYVDQGGGKRKGSIAVYLEPWHADIFEFLELRKNHGNELERARDLFYALWIPDLFMKRVEENGDWTLFCPNEAPGLADVYGQEFEELYAKYEASDLGRKKIKAQSLWFSILDAQVETGTPYVLFKDACNRKSNQQNLGTIRCSNLCTEIVEFTSPDEVAVCNLASLNLSALVIPDPSDSPSPVKAAASGDTVASPQKPARRRRMVYDFARLKELSATLTRNLNKIIDVNHYPVPEARNSNMRHRPIGIGVQGLADAFIKMRYPFESPEAKELNQHLFETIYFGAVEASMELAMEHGPYETYAGSPMSQGKFQFDLWGLDASKLSGMWDWEGLRQKVLQYGVRNSLLLAPMPTASTAQILGNNESVEPFTSNMYSRRVLAGEFTVVNKYLLHDLIDLGLWNEDTRQQIMADRGSVQNVKDMPQDMKDLYKTVWEIKQKTIIDMAADRGPFICQSQSLNIHLASPTTAMLTSMHFYSWKKGLKTGMYYLRTRPKADAIQFTVDQQGVDKRAEDAEVAVCRKMLRKTGVDDEEEECLTCSA